MPRTRSTATDTESAYTRVARSPIEGVGVFARRNIPAWTRLFEYTGERRTVESILAEPLEEAPEHIYLFSLSDEIVIDGAVGGSDARFINHGCEPNVEAYIEEDRLFIYSTRDIGRGEELVLDYQMEPWTEPASMEEAIAEYGCRCGSPRCRGTMLAKPVGKRVGKQRKARK